MNKLSLKYVLIFSTFVSVSKTLHKSLSIERVETQSAGLFAFNDLSLSLQGHLIGSLPESRAFDRVLLGYVPYRQPTIKSVLIGGKSVSINQSFKL